MKTLCFYLLLKLLLPSLARSDPNEPTRRVQAKIAFINEIHYSNQGTDANEYIEIAIPSDVSDISNYKIELYAGKYGSMYRNTSLSEAFVGSNSNGLTFWQLAVTGIRNGGDVGDGIALVDSGTVLEFLSYEGTFTAKSGGNKPERIGSAAGMVSTPMGVHEEGAPDGTSLQRGGTGCAPGDFTWQESLPETFGSVNQNQIIDCGAGISSTDPPTATPATTAPPTATPATTAPPTPTPVTTAPPTPLPAPTSPPLSQNADIFINEFHYDSYGSDQSEFIEVAYKEGMDISPYRIELYNGKNKKMYKIMYLNESEIGLSINGLSFCHLTETHFNGVTFQNGVMDSTQNKGDGMALIGPNDEVLQFLSYEGVIEAGIDGAVPAGTLSVDVGVSETEAPIGTSLQLGGTGCFYDDFTWQTSQNQTMGNVNVGQTINCRENIPAPVTYIPGMASVVENGLLLSEGLTAKLIATEFEYVQLADGTNSTAPFHKDPDGAAVFEHDNGWIYVSNSEESNGGVGALYFNNNGEVIDYKMILTGTVRNCGGGKTFWGTWLTCEETPSGQVWEIDPWGQRVPTNHTIIGIPGGDKYESAAYDNRDPMNPTFYVTTDHEVGPVLKFTPDAQAVQYANSTGDYTNLLYSNETGTAKTEFLVIEPTNGDNGSGGGTYYWTSNLTLARQSAFAYYQKSEGIDIRDGFCYITCKKEKMLFILDLDGSTYVSSSTRSGAFGNQPDQVARILGDTAADDILYFCEDGSANVCGVHGRDSSGRFFTILESSSDDITGETTGLAFSPDNKHMYCSFQKPGFIYDITRKDGYPFGGQRLDIKYHADLASGEAWA